MPAKPRMPKPSVLLFLMVAMGAVATMGMYAGSLVDGRWSSWLIRSIVWGIGGFVVFLVFRLLKAFGSGAGEPAEVDPIDDQLGHARRSLAAAGVKGRGALGKLPAVLVLGRAGSAKSSFVLRSGLDPEHLSGNLYDGPALEPTEALNIWFHEGLLIVEAAGDVIKNQSRWGRFVKKVRPNRLLPALLRQPQAARVAVVCFNAEELVQPGAEESVLAAAAELRDRLSELSASIGIRLPVYVVFTRSDLIPFFTEFAENLTEQEAVELLGATLRTTGDVPASAYKDRESQRLQEAFDDLYQSLAERRLSVLSRSGSANQSAKAYEFPREFRKVSVLAKRFLVELGRPNQLRVSPFLRGFYFTGVRPVAVAVDGPPQAVSPIASDVPGGATQIFSAQQVQQAMAQPAPASQRRVPQAVFLRGILRRVVFADRVAMGITGGGFGLNALRRASLTLALVAVLMIGIGVVVGQAADRSLRSDVRAAIGAVENVRTSDPSFPGQSDLEALDGLRAQTARLSDYENEGRPLRRFLWLYSGGDLYPLAKRVYFDRFENVLLNRARRGIAATLGSLPSEPTLTERDRVYDALKAHIEMTDRPDLADSTYFARVLWDFWAGQGIPAERVGDLTRAQFAFFGYELPRGNPFPGPANDRQVATARAFLAENTSDESFYQGILAQANRFPSFSLNRDMPETEPYLVNTTEVPGAFTAQGWEDVTETLSDAERFFNRDLHVVGNEFYLSLDARGFDPDALALSLRARYEADYANAWAELLGATTYVTRGVTQAEQPLRTYGSNQSALFRLLGVVAENTLDISSNLDAIFQPVRMLTGADSTSQSFSPEHGEPYLGQIRSLASAVGVLAADPGSNSAQEALRAAASDGTAFVGGVQVDFPTDPSRAGEVSRATASLLAAPFDWARGAAGQGSVLAANRIAQQFCSQAGVLRRYPFRVSGQEASWEDVHDLFNPDDGSVFRFFEDAEQHGGLNASYTRFKRTAEAVSASFYESGPDVPSFRILVSFDARDPIELSIDGSTASFTSGQRDSRPLTWSADRAQQARLVVNAPSRPGPLEFSGTWAIFRLFYAATSWTEEGQAARVVWSLSDGNSVSAQVRYQREALLDPGYFQGLTCPTRIAG